MWRRFFDVIRTLSRSPAQRNLSALWVSKNYLLFSFACQHNDLVEIKGVMRRRVVFGCRHEDRKNPCSAPELVLARMLFSTARIVRRGAEGVLLQPARRSALLVLYLS